MMRNIGEMNKRISFLLHEEGVDPDSGYPLDTWVEKFTVWAYKEDLRGNEFFGAAAVQMEKAVTFTVHYRADIENHMFIRYQGDDYDILDIGGGRNIGDFLQIRARKREQEVSDGN